MTDFVPEDPSQEPDEISYVTEELEAHISPINQLTSSGVRSLVNSYDTQRLIAENDPGNIATYNTAQGDMEAYKKIFSLIGLENTLEHQLENNPIRELTNQDIIKIADEYILARLAYRGLNIRAQTNIPFINPIIATSSKSNSTLDNYYHSYGRARTFAAILAVLGQQNLIAEIDKDSELRLGKLQE